MIFSKELKEAFKDMMRDSDYDRVDYGSSVEVVFKGSEVIIDDEDQYVTAKLVGFHVQEEVYSFAGDYVNPGFCEWDNSSSEVGVLVSFNNTEYIEAPKDWIELATDWAKEIVND